MGLALAKAAFLEHPGVAVRVGEVSEAGVIAAIRVGAGIEAPSQESIGVLWRISLTCTPRSRGAARVA
jgi:hypothetical protein